MSEAQITWEKYKDLPTPKPGDLVGKWRIKMDGWRKIFFKNVKVIYKFYLGGTGVGAVTRTSISRIAGYNIAFWFRKWGRFTIKEDGTLVYENRKIVDWLVRVRKDRMKGLYLKDGKPVATFTMERI